MDKEGESFENALKEAQNLGYAERNPEADVEGHDTCRKIAILTAMATGKEVNYEDIYTEGITRITDIDFKYAEKMGTSVKLFGTSRIKDGRVLAYVAPVMINKTSPLYSVNDVFNGILVKGNMLGTSMFYGSGAGKLPTGSAVVADIIEAAQNLKKNVPMGWTDETQKVANELYAQYPVTQQRQISIYYQTEDGKTLTKQMESYSPKEVSGTQIWDCQDYTRNSLWAISTRVKKIIWNSCLIIFTSLLESVILFSAFSLKKNYYSNCPTKTTKEEHNEKQ